MFFYIAATQPDRGRSIVPRRWPVWARGLAGYAVTVPIFLLIAWAIRANLSEVPARFGLWLALMVVVDVVGLSVLRRRRRRDGRRPPETVGGGV